MRSPDFSRAIPLYLNDMGSIPSKMADQVSELLYCRRYKDSLFMDEFQVIRIKLTMGIPAMFAVGAINRVNL